MSSDGSGRSDLVSYLAVENVDGQIIGVWWRRVATLAFGGYTLSFVVSVAEVLNAIGDAFGTLGQGIQSWYSDYLGAVVGVAISLFEGGYQAAESSLSAVGIAAGPLGLAIALLALYLWVTIE
jgi:hypothetical protein